MTADNSDDPGSATVTQPSPGEPEAPKKAPRWRRVTVAVLVILSCVLGPVAVLGIWVHNTLLDQSQYVETVAPLASDPAIINGTTNRIVNTLFDNVDVEQKARDALPEKAQFLAGPLATGLESFTRQQTQRFLESDKFKTLWEELNKRAHQQLEKALTGGGKVVSTKEGKVQLDLAPVALKVRVELKKRGIGIFDKIPINRLALKFELFDAGGLKKAQKGVDLMNALRVALPILVFGLFGIAFALSPNRRRTTLRWGLGIALSMVITGIVLSLGRSLYLDSVTGAGFRSDAAASAFDTVVRYLRNSIRLMFTFGLFVAAGAFLTGPSHAAVSVRGFARGGIGGAGARMNFGAFGAWVARSKTGLRIAGVLIAFMLLVMWDRPRPLTVLGVSVLLLVYLGLIEFFGQARTERDDGDESGDDTPSGPTPAVTGA